jgi:predicted Ser/Thr protein kinase
VSGLEPGSELGGFVIEAVAGRGGMGVVYRARQLRPERTVALKVISPEFANDPGFQERFARESELAARIEHPNVIPVYSVGEDAGVLYIAMRFVDGTDLREVLTQAGRLEPRHAVAIVNQIAEALDAAHSLGLVHRDVKPSNVLIATSGGNEHAYLTDFGLSRHIDSSQGVTATGAFVGTIDYVAPEQVRGERLDARTDVYSLGCMLFQSLTGTVPFPLPNDIAKMYAHNAQPPPVASERVPELPRAFDAVLSRAMAKEPDERFLSAGDLGRAALAACDNATVSRAERNVATGGASPADVTSVPARAGSGEASPPADVGETLPALPGPLAGSAATVAATGGSGSGSAATPRRRWPLLVLAAVAVAAIALVVVLVSGGDGGGGDKPAAGAKKATAAPAPAGHRIVGLRRLHAKRSMNYTLALSVPRDAAGGKTASVPLTMSLLAARGSEPLRVVQREKLPSPPYTFAKDSYISDFQLDSTPDGSGNVGISWYVHPGGKAVTCYSGVSLGGISLYSCG